MTQPTHDGQGNELLPDEEFERLHMMEREDFDKEPEALREKYEATFRWHQARRMGDIDEESIVTGDGLTYRQVVDGLKAKKAQVQETR